MVPGVGFEPTKNNALNVARLPDFAIREWWVPQDLNLYSPKGEHCFTDRRGQPDIRLTPKLEIFKELLAESVRLELTCAEATTV